MEDKNRIVVHIVDQPLWTPKALARAPVVKVWIGWGGGGLVLLQPQLGGGRL